MNATKNWLFALLAALWVLALPAQAVTTDIYYHNDLAGSPIAATDSSGTLLWRQGYKPYGERINPKAPSDQQPWFVSKAYVEGAGLAYFGARWYDPQLGRFMGIDPKGFDEANVHSFNRYAYANDNPYRYVDPDGKNPLLLLGRFVGGGAIGGGLGTLADAASQYAAFREVDWGMAAQSSAAREGALAGSMSFLPAGTPVGLGIRSVEEGAARGGAAAARLGQAGEAAVRAAYDIGPTTRVLVNGVERIPDGLTGRVLSEVKNVGSLSYTQQLRDFATFAQQTGRQFDLYVRPGTQLSGPLSDAIRAGEINLRFIPGL
jgi:RHS repeat-associated protein